MSVSFAKSAFAVSALAAVSIAGSESEAALRGYVVSGELLLFSAADQELPSGWSVVAEGALEHGANVLSLSGLCDMTTSGSSVVSLYSKPMATGRHQLVLRNAEGRSFGLGDLSLALVDGKWSLLSTGDFAGRAAFELVESSTALVRQSDDAFTLTGELVLSETAMHELGIEGSERCTLGAVTLIGSAFFDPARKVELAAPAASAGVGPDVVVSTIGSTFGEYGAVGSIGAYAVTTVSCNIGTTDAIWIDTGTQPNRHPVIGTQLYRLKSVAGATRFEQIGMSWLKHGFCAADAPNCTNLGPPGSAYAGNGSCDWLGLFATDTYGDSLNASQPGCGPRSEVNPWTGVYPFPYILGGGASGNAIYKRLQVNNSDLDPAQNSGATYWGEVVYICTDEPDVHKYNNYSVRSTTVGGLSGGQYNLSFGGSTIPMKSALEQWATVDPGVSIKYADIAGDGRIYLGTKVTNLGVGQYHYEYALFNMNSDRGAQALSVPLSSGAILNNVGFHDVDYHSGEPYALTDWSANVVPNSSVTWSTQTFAANPNANALRWSTTYNYRFDSNAAPQQGQVTVTLFKPGTPTTITFNTDVPGSSCGTFSYCSTSVTTNGCGPTMSGSGTPSAVNPSGFTITCSNLEGQKNGLFFFGLGQTSVAWAVGSTSTRCVTAPVQRLPSANSGGTAGACDGSISVDWNAWRAANPTGLGSPYSAGQTLFAQTWFRDPPAPTATNLSNALGWTICP